MKKLIFTCLVSFVFIIVLSAFGFAEHGTVVIVSGNVKDSVNGNPVAGAIVSANIDISPVKSDQNGNFKFIVVTSTAIEIKVNKEGYDSFEKVIKPQERVDLSIKLKPQKTRIDISMTSFQSNGFISGRVTGLSPSSYRDYKILVYVLTNKWYIHPWAENAEGRGFANINEDGSWRIETVWRGYQAYRVAFLVTNRTTLPPSTIDFVSDNPVQDILSKINPIAFLVIDAPKGI